MSASALRDPIHRVPLQLLEGVGDGFVHVLLLLVERVLTEATWSGDQNWLASERNNTLLSNANAFFVRDGALSKLSSTIFANRNHSLRVF